MPIIKQCAYCGNTIKVSPSKLSTHNFCNRDCYNKFHATTKQTVFICEECGKEFISKKTTNANKYCSRKCYNKAHVIKNKERECPQCHKRFTATQSEDIYCSRECYLKYIHAVNSGENHWNWQGGITSENEKLRKSVEYKDWQQSVYKKDHYQCQICGSKKEINAHHLSGWKEYPDKRFDIDNGITLCKDCHIKVHQKYGWSSTEQMDPGFLKKQRR